MNDVSFLQTKSAITKAVATDLKRGDSERDVDERALPIAVNDSPGLGIDAFALRQESASIPIFLNRETSGRSFCAPYPMTSSASGGKAHRTKSAAVAINLGQDAHAVHEEDAEEARRSHATNSATLPCRQGGSLYPAQRYAKRCDVAPTQWSAPACRR